jgi:hypothetical protein
MEILLLLALAATASASSQAEYYANLPPLSGVLCQLFMGGIPLCPASSCKEAADTRLWAPRSGLHWLTDGSQLYQAYCQDNIPGSDCRGFQRVFEFSSINGCPEGLEPISAGGMSLCRKTVDSGCSSVVVSNTHGVSYSKVCGLVTGFRKATTDGFFRYNCPGCNINKPYVDGVSITHGSPRQHIWSMATLGPRCESCNPSPAGLPSFVGQDYFCDGKANTFQPADQLWGELSCGRGQYFCKELPEATTDNIELRVCADQGRIDEDVYIEHVELYVQ